MTTEEKTRAPRKENPTMIAAKNLAISNEALNQLKAKRQKLATARGDLDERIRREEKELEDCRKALEALMPKTLMPKATP